MKKERPENVKIGRRRGYKEIKRNKYTGEHEDYMKKIADKKT